MNNYTENQIIERRERINTMQEYYITNALDIDRKYLLKKLIAIIY